MQLQILTDTTSLNHALTQSGLKIVDFRGEALTFKTCFMKFKFILGDNGCLINSVSSCTEFMTQREDLWKKKHEREVQKRKKLEENFNQALKRAQRKKAAMGGPDCEEGPHSTLNEDEFYDAVELGLDRLEEEAAFKEA
ncbi:Collagen type IV alpha-3-binding protein [Orchesella cincta]|uniref:Collagen type IV alpha-3-binding protein n=1 Tax=Orchesella cincta TaxID=48709 RepID=A0A1D2MIH5_ORCCI|nr:Collagen type IV alpha-3-binding protein [Orchesella cincta]